MWTNVESVSPLAVLSQRRLAVEAESVTRDVGPAGSRVRALGDADLEVYKGERLAVLGPAGSGKSTLLGCLGGLDAVTSGRVAIQGVDISAAGDQARLSISRRHAGFVFQRFHLVSALSTQENVELYVLLNGEGRFSSEKRAHHLLDMVHLSHRRAIAPSRLSEAERRRVAIARALANDPDILFVDEPAAGLDLVDREMIMNLLVYLNERFGKTLVLATRDPKVAAVCDRTVHMANGRLIGMPSPLRA